MGSLIGVLAVATSAWAETPPSAGELGLPDVEFVGEHARQMQLHPKVVARKKASGGQAGGQPSATPGPDMTVYGYLAYWADDLDTVPWDNLSHIAVFQAGIDEDGNLTGTSTWDNADDVVARAEPYGVKTHLCVTNFSSGSIGAFLDSPTARSHAIDQLREWVDATGADGVNIDFEGLLSANKQDLVDFAEELNDEFGDEVVFATPAVDWNGAWDYSEITRFADVFIMGYGYHYSGSGTAGPVDPLYGGGVWGDHSLEWTVEDYLTYDADPDRVILGLPLYGYSWPVASNDVPADATGTGSAVFWVAAQDKAAQYGASFDEQSRTPYYYGGGRQGWYQNTDSVRERVIYTRESGIAGVGFWALNYDEQDPELWAMMDEETNFTVDTGDTGDTGDTEETGDTDQVYAQYIANVGLPFLAYVGDTVRLSGLDSTAPDGQDLEFRWTQVAGPAVELSDPSGAQPEFPLKETGTLAFELEVGDGVVWSPPATSYVIVIDPALGVQGCGCNSTPWGGAWAGIAGLLAYRRRRSVAR